MSSETSTRQVRLKPDASDAGLQPWQFFLLAALGCATAVTFISRGQGTTAVILLGLLMATAAVVGYAALRAVRPLVSPEHDRTVMVGQRTRVALEREKTMALRSIKELEFDRAMGRLSDEDWREMSGRLRARAARLMRQLDAGAGYRQQIERDLTKRLGADAAVAPKPARDRGTEEPSRGATPGTGIATPRAAAAGTAGPDISSAIASAEPSADQICTACATRNDADSRFCKSCGQALAPR